MFKRCEGAVHLLGAFIIPVVIGVVWIGITNIGIGSSGLIIASCFGIFAFALEWITTGKSVPAFFANIANLQGLHGHISVIVE